MTSLLIEAVVAAVGAGLLMALAIGILGLFRVIPDFPVVIEGWRFRLRSDLQHPPTTRQLYFLYSQVFQLREDVKNSSERVDTGLATLLKAIEETEEGERQGGLGLPEETSPSEPSNRLVPSH